MKWEAALAEIEAGLASFQDVGRLVERCVAIAQAEGARSRLRIHARLAQIFDEHADFESARGHARLAIESADAASDASDAALVASSLQRRDVFEIDLEELRDNIAIAARMAATWPSELDDYLADARAQLSRSLPMDAEREANERALVELLERRGDDSLEELTSSRVRLCRLLLATARRDEAIAIAERIVARDRPPTFALVEAYAVLWEAYRARGDDDASAVRERGAALARAVDSVPESNTDDVIGFLLAPRPFPEQLVSPERVVEVSFGMVADPATRDERGRPTEDGLLSEKIFGPLAEFTCACGELSSFASYGQQCPRCRVEARTSRLRQWRFGSIRLSRPVMHPRCVTAVAALLDMSPGELRDVTSFDEPVLGGPLDAEQSIRERLRDGGARSFGGARGRADHAILEVLPVPPPDAERSPLRRPEVIAAYEAVLAANRSDPAALQGAVDALFTAL